MPEKRIPSASTQPSESPEPKATKDEAECQSGDDRSAAARQAIEEQRVVKEWHVREDRLDFTELVRSIQRTEGNEDCFKKRRVCQEMGCSWRPYCLSAPSTDVP